MRHFEYYPLQQLPQRIGMAAKAIVQLLYFKPQYLALAAIVSVVFYEVIFWFLNLGLMQHLLTSSSLTLSDKWHIIASSYGAVFMQPYSPLALMLFAVSVLQGVVVAALVYTIRCERQFSHDFIKDLGGTGLAGALAVVGLGCAACGTSLVTPILAFFFTTSSAALADEVGLYAAGLSLIVAIVTVYLAGHKLSQRLDI